MGWIKKGVIFETEKQMPWMVSHACVPTVHILNDDTFRVFFAPRNKLGQSILTFFDVNAHNPSEVKYVHYQPILPLGELGTFDDGGIMPCCIVEEKGLLYLFYVGWNPSGSVPYRNAIGLAVSDDNGVTFRRPFQGAILDRNRDEPFFTASPWVMKDDDRWHIWYASSTGFLRVKGKVEPLYIIKYGHSQNGIDWERENITCIEPKTDDEANARATVIKESGLYKMWYAFRGSYDFRDGKDSYRIGYAESENAIDWQRMDKKSGLQFSESGWDSKMQTYPCVVKHQGRKYLFYNGNGFGKTGIGYALWED